MPEHPIRLRGAWDWISWVDGVEVVRRVPLPTVWPDGQEAPSRLVRKFGRPPINHGLERVRLELVGVPGLLSARLNGSEILRSGGDRDDWIVELIEPLPARNVLELEVDLRLVGRSVGGRAWGAVALVIVPKEV